MPVLGAASILGAELSAAANVVEALVHALRAVPTAALDRLPIRGLDGLPVTLLTALAVAVIVGAAASRPLRIPAWRLMVWTAAVALPTAATWTIPASAIGDPATFDFCEIGRLPLPRMLTNGLPIDVWTNILLTVPAGAAAVLWPWGARRLAILLATLASPIVIELVQLTPALHRGCQLGDVINNMIGVVAGFLLATGVESLLLAWRDAVRQRHTQARHTLPRSYDRLPR